MSNLYSHYTPPFIVSAQAINLVAEISAQVERYAIRLEQSDALRLRKANRIKTIHSSLAIEGNTLSEEQVEDIIDGKHVVAPIREIQEVRNAIKAYELYRSLNPFKVDDLLRAHKTMMEALTDDAGHFRSGGVGVFEGDRCLHMAPPARRVPMLVNDLFYWLRHAPDHLLIRSCVFHYEFEFIHPFSDGNGRMGRLWQSLILGRLHPVFEYLPIENLVYANQQQYYDAIAKSTEKADSGPFIDFMLTEILNTLKQHQGEPLTGEVPNGVPNEVPNKVPNGFPNEIKAIHPELADMAWQVLELIKLNNRATSSMMGEKLGISDRMVRKYILQLRDVGLIERVGGNRYGYWKIIND